MKKTNSRAAKIIVDVAVLSALLLGASNIALATTGTVAATVTLQNISVAVTDSDGSANTPDVSYGTLAVNTSNNTLAGTGGMNTTAGDQQIATNTGNIAEDFKISGSDSAAWTLSSSSGADAYVHRFCTASCGTYASPTTGNFTALTTSLSTLASNVSTSGTQTFDLMLTTPTSSATYTAQTVNVTVTAIAH